MKSLKTNEFKAEETHPRLQAGKLTAWELAEEGIPAKLIVDSDAAILIRDGKIDVILVGEDGIANNGDVANKIGTFMLSVVAQRTTIDFEVESGGNNPTLRLFENRMALLEVGVVLGKDYINSLDLNI